MKKIANYIPLMCLTAILIAEIVAKSSGDIIDATLIAGIFIVLWS